MIRRPTRKCAPGARMGRKRNQSSSRRHGYQATPFVGTAGTVTSLAAMVQKLPAYERARIHNYRLQLETIQELEQMLLSRKKADRGGLPGLEKGREEVIAAGAIIIRTVMEMLGQSSMLVSDLGLREGVPIEMATRTRWVRRVGSNKQ